MKGAILQVISCRGIGGALAGPVLGALMVSLSWSLAAAGTDTQGGCITAECHSRILQHKFVHGPAAVELCEQCHRRTGKHIFKLAAAGEELCYICHERGRAKKVNCIKCHDPHGSELEFQLKAGAGKRCIK